MNLMDLSAKFVKEVNMFVLRNREANPVTERLVERIKSVQTLAKDAEDRVRVVMEKLQIADVRKDKPFYITKGGTPICVVGKDIPKPRIEEIKMEKTGCEHCVSFRRFEPLAKVTYVETSKQLMLIDKNIEQAAIEVFSHTYRSYNGFICFITLYDMNGSVYVVDAIKFRNHIPSLRLLNCGVPKIVHCRECVRMILLDFKQLSCFRNYDMSPINVFVDWRIRPVDDFLLHILQEGAIKTVEQMNTGKAMEVFSPDQDEELIEINNITSRYGVSADNGMLRNLLKLRRFLAKSNDESTFYVMSDDQLIRLFSLRPKIERELSSMFKRLSPLARQHLCDFLLVLNGDRKEFSLQKFMDMGECTKLPVEKPGME